jgi:hypothetical protein
VLQEGLHSHGRTDYTKANEKAWIFTTQFYFDPTFSKAVHEAVEPYKTRTKLSAYADAMAANEANNSGRHATATKVGDKVVAQFKWSSTRPEHGPARPTDEQPAIRRRVAPAGSLAFLAANSSLTRRPRRTAVYDASPATMLPRLCERTKVPSLKGDKVSVDLDAGLRKQAMPDDLAARFHVRELLGEGGMGRYSSPTTAGSAGSSH